MLLQIVDQPGEEPVDLARLYLQLNLYAGGTSPPSHKDDPLLLGYQLAARIHVEGRTNLRLINQKWRLILPEQQSVFVVPLGPIVELTAASYEQDGVDVALTADEYYLGNEAPPKVHADIAIKSVEFVVGFGEDPEDVPEPLRLAIQMLVAHWYGNREPVVVGTISATLPHAVNDLIWPYRVLM